VSSRRASRVAFAALSVGLACAPDMHAAQPAPAAAAVCQGCHGAGGKGNAPAGIPRIAGQSPEYLEKQLKDYATGDRANPVMQNFAKPLSDADRRIVSTYFSSLQPPFTAAPSKAFPAQLARGHQIADEGIESLRVQACISCHGPDGVGVLHAAPYLGGQTSDYLTSALKHFKDGTRKNDTGKLMSSVTEGLKEADIVAVAAYFSSLDIGAP
jgi:cytochrome c553